MRIEISAIAVRKNKHQLFGISSSKKVKITVVSDILQTYDNMLENSFFIKLNEDDLMPEIDEEDIPLPTEGNPTPDILADISRILGINYYFELTPSSSGGSTLRFPLEKGDIILADRHYGKAKALDYVVSSGGDFVMRLKHKAAKTTFSEFNI